MGEGTHERKPTLSPPPRITGPRGTGPSAGPSGSRSRFDPRRLLHIVLFAILALGLVGVFVLLPRWQDRRQQPTVATDTAREITSPTPRQPVPAAAVEGAASTAPSPNPSPTRQPTPTLKPPRSTSPPRPSAAENRYVEAMSDGLAALNDRRWQDALAAFDRAARMRPDAPEVADGRARAKAGQRQEALGDGLRRARDFEQREAWRDAERAYSAVLAMDPESAAAQDCAHLFA